MPKLRPAPTTLDQWVGTLLETEMRQAGFTQESLAERAGMPVSNLGRSIRGVRPFTPTELMLLVGITGSARSAGELLDEAIARCDDLHAKRHGPRARVDGL